jgi:hypothetical protein
MLFKTHSLSSIFYSQIESMKDVILYYLLPMGLVVVIWMVAINYLHRKRRQRRSNRRFGGRR